MALLWIQFHLPLPTCVFHAVSGLPCPTCGATRGLVALLHGNVNEAWRFNPLAFATLAAVGLFDLYAVVTWFMRGSRLRLTHARFSKPTMARSAIIATIAINWIYLIQRGDI